MILLNCPHCNTHIDEHPASRCLARWVAEDVMELEIKIYPGVDNPHYYPKDDWNKDCPSARHTLPVPDYPTSISAAWEVHKKACDLLFSRRTAYLRYILDSVGARVIDGYPKYRITWPDAMIFLEPEDICRAAIKVAKSND